MKRNFQYNEFPLFLFRYISDTLEMRNTHKNQIPKEYKKKNKLAMKLKFRPRLFRPSTLSFTQEALHMRGYSFFDWLHGYVYGRWSYLYIGIGTGELPRNRVLRGLVRKVKRLFSSKAAANPSTELRETPSRQNLDTGTFADNYHGKVVTLEAAKKLVTVKEEADLTTPEQVIPYTHARDIILHNPDHTVALECPLPCFTP